MSSSEYYERYWTPEGYNPRLGSGLPSEVAELYRRNMKPGRRVLDLGCGNGLTSGPLLTELGAEYVGADVASSAVDAARAAGLEAHTVPDAAELPFEDASFDMAVCVEVMEHLFRPDHAARELKRVLRHGAPVLVTVPNVGYWRRRTDLALFGRWHPYGDDRSIEEPWRDPHIRFFTLDALRRMLQHSGFEAVDVRGHGGSILRELPLLRRLGSGGASRAYRSAERQAPGLLAARLHAVARRAG